MQKTRAVQMQVSKKLEKAISYLTDKHNAAWCEKYGEPGYSDPEKGIIFANWNHVPKGLADWLEKCGYSLEWADEWTVDHNYGKAYRTSADSYSWESQTLITDDGELLTPDDDASAWIDECAMTDHSQPVRHCLPSRIGDAELTDAGFTLFADKQETGLHAGMDDDPVKQARAAFDAGAVRVVFRKVENSQFYHVWQCWAEMQEQEQEQEHA